MAADPSIYSNGISAIPLAHTAVPLVYEDEGDPQWIEGEPTTDGLEPAHGDPFSCVLFLPSPGVADTPTRLRTVQTPTLLFNPVRDDGTLVVVGPEDELMITAPELAPFTEGQATTRWQVAGKPQPFGAPGTVIGVLATLRRVED